MFSVVILGKAFKRNSNIYNTLSFAAFILLVINPQAIYNVGFQFSFLAVIGIVYYKDVFRSWVPQKTWLGDKVVTLLSVSLAAQITTFPLGLYYFHQYPNLFMISNLVVIPCITVILYGGIFFIFFSKVCSTLASLLATVLECYIKFISSVVHFIQDIPYAFFEGVHISFYQMISIYGFIIMATLSFRIRKLILLSTLPLIVTLVGFRSGNEITFIASEGILKDRSKLEFVITPYIIKERIGQNYSICPMAALDRKTRHSNIVILGGGVVWFAKKTFVFCDELKTGFEMKVPTDIVFIGKDKSKNFLSTMMSVLRPKQAVVLNSWKFNKRDLLGDLGIDGIVQESFVKIH